MAGPDDGPPEAEPTGTNTPQPPELPFVEKHEVIPPWEERDDEEWAEWLECPAFEYHESIASTNDRARELALEGAEPFTMVAAGTQTAGRGRGGKLWYSPAGRGLWCSVLLPGDPGGTPGIIPLMVGVTAVKAIEETVRRWAPTRTHWVRMALKWPNDLMLPSGKMGGILCETVQGDVPCRFVAGVGMNLRRPPAPLPDGLGQDVRFLDEVADRIPVPALAQALLDELKIWTAYRWDALAGRLEEEWIRRDRLKGQWVECESGPSGWADGIASDGRLRVVTADDRTELVAAGSVRVTEPPDPSLSPPPDPMRPGTP